MLTVSNRINRLSQGLILVSSVLIALLSLRILVLGMDVGFPQLMHHDPDRTVVFLVHVLAGSTALLVMPWQFIKRLRLFSPLLHRCLGWIYMVAVLLAGLAGAALAPFAATNGFAGAGLGLANNIFAFEQDWNAFPLNGRGTLVTQLLDGA